MPSSPTDISPAVDNSLTSARSPGHALEARNISRGYGEVVAVNDVSFRIEGGEFVAILGPSGCGKTTLLRILAGLTSPTSGEVWLDETRLDPVPPHERGIGFVFQSYALFPHMRVAENVAFGLEMRRIPRAEIAVRVDEALALVQMAQFGRRRVNELSGGQQQRVALARALVTQPATLLLDEPFSNLDAKLRVELRTELRGLQRELRITTIFVTHDQAEAMTLADRLLVMHEGSIVQSGTPESIFERPANRFVAGFVGRANFLDAVVDSDAGWVRVGGTRMPATTTLRSPGARVALALRPHRIGIATPTGVSHQLDGVVQDVRYLGERLEVVVLSGSVHIEVSLPTSSKPPAIGEAVALSWDRSDALIVD